MKTISFQRGIHLTPFLTATGFLAAILLVWAQSWINIYEPPWPETVYLGLMWTYSAVIVAVLASALAILSWFRERTSINFKDFTVRGCPIALLVAAFIMTVIDVGQSLVSVTIKLYKPIQLDRPLIELATPIARFGGIIFIFGIIAFIIGMSQLGIKRNKRLWFWIGFVVSLIVSGVVLLVLVLAGQLQPYGIALSNC